MQKIVVQTAAEQVAAYLREELRLGTWRGLVPGGDRLATQLGIGRDTVEAALKQLENQGFLLNQGRRRGRLITGQAGRSSTRKLRLAVLLDENASRRLDYVAAFEHELAQAGHAMVHPSRTMNELGMNVKRIVAMIGKTEADAWLVLSGFQEILEWFEASGKPVFAIFGRRRDLRIAAVAPDKIPALYQAVNALAELGHRRIVLLTRKRRRWPEPGYFERAFLDALERNGIQPGAYHLPDWEETIEDLHARLNKLFRLTPPTAIIIDEAPLYVAVQHFLAKEGMSVPGDVSLVCNDSDPVFDWCDPPVSTIHWNSEPIVRRVLQWASNVSCNKSDLRQTHTPAKFVRGGTIGKARADR